MSKSFRLKSLVALLVTALALPIHFGMAQSLTDSRIVEQEKQRGIVSLYEALTPLKSINSFMTVGAHPDDERSGLLALLSRGMGVRTITVTANRGEGGQNSIGTEYRQALGVLRSREMEQASQAFNVELFFLSESFDDPIFDFSFSKSVEETLNEWGGQEIVMEKLVRAIRESRPDVLFTNFQNVFGQHGHHRTMAQAAEIAYELAADPEAFPEHFEQGLRPFAPAKFYLPAGRGSGLAEEELPTSVSYNTGEYDPIFGASYEQLGQQSRAYHRSQDMGRWTDEGPSQSNLYLGASRVEAAEDGDLFDGMPNNLGEYAELVDDETLAGHLEGAQAAIDEALAAFPDFVAVNEAVITALNEVRAARDAVEGADLDEEMAFDLDFRLAKKEDELQYASRTALSLVTRVVADNPELTRGGSTTVTVSAFLGGEVPVENVTIDLTAPEGWTVEEVENEAQEGVDLAYNETVTAQFLVTVPEDAEDYNPYIRNVHPFRANTGLNGVISYEVDGTEVTARIDPTEIVAVLPDVSLRVTPANLVHNVLRPDEPIQLEVAATNYVDGPVDTALTVDVPEGWTVEPGYVEVSFARKGDATGASFTLTPPQDVEIGGYDFVVRAEGDAQSDKFIQVIGYDHIGRTYLVQDATANLQVLELEFPEEVRIGYVDGGSDTVYEGLRRAGMDVELLSEDDLTTGDLDRFDTIVVGIYAYRLRPDLAAANSRLMEWVERGGNLLVQYHRPVDNWHAEETPPYEIELGRVSLLARVTDPNAPVEFLMPEHPLMNVPNELGTPDFDNWVKERGLYFAEEWAEEYDELFSITDTQWSDTEEETPFLGTLLTAEYGEGRYTYTSLVLHTQIDNNVPGVYRLYANLLTPPHYAD